MSVIWAPHCPSLRIYLKVQTSRQSSPPLTVSERLLVLTHVSLVSDLVPLTTHTMKPKTIKASQLGLAAGLPLSNATRKPRRGNPRPFRAEYYIIRHRM